MWIDSTAGLAYVAAAEGAHDEAAEHCRELLARWEESEDHHYAIWGLRWAAGFLARRGDRAGAHACAEALTRIASDDRPRRTRSPRSRTRSARRRCSRATPTTAAEQLSRAVEIHRGLDVPFERAQIELRAGVALAAAGEREPGARAPRRRLPHRPQARRAPARRRGRQARSPRSASRSTSGSAAARPRDADGAG